MGMEQCRQGTQVKHEPMVQIVRLLCLLQELDGDCQAAGEHPVNTQDIFSNIGWHLFGHGASLQVNIYEP